MTEQRTDLPSFLSNTTWLAQARRFQQHPLIFLREVLHKHPDIACLLLPEPVVLVIHPTYVQRVLQESLYTYHKAENSARGQRIFGNGLITSNGDYWKQQRKMMQPAFHRRHAGQWDAVMVSALQALLTRWELLAQRGQPVDIAAEMQRLTLGILASALFGSDISQESEQIGQAMNTLLRVVRQPTATPQFEAAAQTLDVVVTQMIEARRAGTSHQDDVLTLLLQAQEKDSAFVTDALLRDEMMSLLVAGHETTAAALSWTWYLLAEHPEVEEKLHQELDLLGGTRPTSSDLPNLPYTRMVFEESMRLYPPVWATSRVTKVNGMLGPYMIPAGMPVLLSPFLTHRHPDFWPHPERFDPERFTPAHVAGRPHFAFFPFGGGPRQCIGQHFALIEAHLTLATIAQRYRLRVASDAPIEPEPGVTLRMRGKLPMLLERVG